MATLKTKFLADVADTLAKCSIEFRCMHVPDKKNVDENTVIKERNIQRLQYKAIQLSRSNLSIDNEKAIIVIQFPISAKMQKEMFDSNLDPSIGYDQPLVLVQADLFLPDDMHGDIKEQHIWVASFNYGFGDNFIVIEKDKYKDKMCQILISPTRSYVYAQLK